MPTEAHRRGHFKNSENAPGRFGWRFGKAAVFLYRVSRLKIVVAMTVLAFWMPATSFCLMENAGWLVKNNGCCSDQPSEMAPCCTLASATYKTDESRSATAPSPAQLSALCIDFSELDSSPKQLASAAESGVSPPELLTSWQFSSRAAPAPRAPSSAS
jgi:hypothetical protein